MLAELGLSFLGPTLLIGAVLAFVIRWLQTGQTRVDHQYERNETDKIQAQPSKVPTKRSNPAMELAKSQEGCRTGSGDCACANGQVKDESVKRVVVMYGTTTGNSKSLAEILKTALESKSLQVDMVDVSSIEPEDRLPQESQAPNSVLVVIISTYTEGTPPESAQWFYRWLEESSKDFR